MEKPQDKLKLPLSYAFSKCDISKHTFEAILEELNITPYQWNGKYSKAFPKVFFKIKNELITGDHLISFRDIVSINKFIKAKRGGREKSLGGVYRLKDNNTVCRVIDFEETKDGFLYTVELLRDHLNSTEFYDIRTLQEDKIGSIYNGISTPYVDPLESNYEKWIHPKEIIKEEYY